MNAVKKISLIAVSTLSILFTGVASAEKIPKQVYNSRLETVMMEYMNQNYSDAFPQLETYAKAGEKGAQYLIGILMIQGMGTEVNTLEGAAWLKLATEQRDNRWLKTLEKVESMLRPEERELVDKRVAELTNAYGVEAQKMNCRWEKPTGSNQRLHRCQKKQVMDGYVYVDDSYVSDMDN